MRKNRSRANTRAAASLAGDLMLAPMVVAMRLPLMAMETPAGGLSGGEVMRAATEKAEAFAEGLIAAQLSYFQSAVGFWPDIFSGRTPSLLSGHAAERSLHAALVPSGRRVKANFRRLSRMG